MAGALSELWYGNVSGAALLAPLAWIYGAAIGLRRYCYEHGILPRHAVGCPVIVVGNLTVGGTGKTPLVAWLARELVQQGYRVGIVARGYGSRVRAPRLVTPQSSWREVGDEPLLLSRSTGCITAVGVDRVAAGRLLSAQGCNIVVSDDGLQHLALAADYQIVVVDAERGFGNGRLLPAGPLREPIAALRRADAVVVNGAALGGASLRGAGSQGSLRVEMRLVPAEAVALCGGERRALEEFRRTLVHAVAGIGNPARFFRMLRGIGLEIVEHAFADHQPLVASDLEFGDDLPVLMTEKDAVKCDGFAAARLWYVPVTAHLSAGDASELLAHVVRRLKSHRR
jgi:tetraacyldisaccharide 4'-kinase